MDKDELIQTLEKDLGTINWKLDTMSDKKQSKEILELVQAKRVTIKSLIELGAFNEKS